MTCMLPGGCCFVLYVREHVRPIVATSFVPRLLSHCEEKESGDTAIQFLFCAADDVTVLVCDALQ